MKKLFKKNEKISNSLEAYGCGCGCQSKCYPQCTCSSNGMWNASGNSSDQIAENYSHTASVIKGNNNSGM